MGSLAPGHAADFVLADLRRYAVELCHVVLHPRCSFPTSVVVASASRGTRTILHANSDLPDVTACDFEQVDLSQYKWIHWEVRPGAVLTPGQGAGAGWALVAPAPAAGQAEARARSGAGPCSAVLCCPAEHCQAWGRPPGPCHATQCGATPGSAAQCSPAGGCWSGWRPRWLCHAMLCSTVRCDAMLCSAVLCCAVQPC
uniref:Ketohexokinase n=1 Tax=Apteryx owenii TaxID=8824 RepID=A0A8B9QQL3_APTOW